ncbi:MAG: transporter permease [Frankiales bacterium]|nr:transporter permease [Frankiales bacterium]
MTTAVRRAPERRVPPLGGFSLTFLRLEIRRLLRNRRTVVFTLVVPPVFFWAFGTGHGGEAAGRGNVTAYVMISLAVYGAMIATTAGGASVAIERAVGWSRQLRLTPLDPAAYVVVKVLTAMVLGALSVAIVYAVGTLGGAHMPAWAWVVSGLVAWACALVFAAFGLFMGYLLPSENVMQVLGPVLALLAFFGGLFVPLSVLGAGFRTLAQYTPAYGVGVLARAPLTGDAVTVGAVANVVVWTLVFGLGAVWRFRRDTGRV